jgi:hypothetical protein
MSDDSNETVEPEATPDPPKLVYEVALDLEGFPKGGAVQIAGLGTYANGSTFDVDEDEHTAYRAHHSVQVMGIGHEGEIIVEEIKPGPTLLQAYEHTDGVEVTTYAGGKS